MYRERVSNSIEVYGTITSRYSPFSRTRRDNQYVTVLKNKYKEKIRGYTNNKSMNPLIGRIVPLGLILFLLLNQKFEQC